MDSKINFPKVKKLKDIKTEKTITLPAKNTLSAQSGAKTPYFSPISHRTRNYKNGVVKDVKPTVTGTKQLFGDIKPSPASESVVKTEEKLSASPRKHIKIEYDENRVPVVEIKQEVKEELDVEKNDQNEQKPVKKAKKRSSGGKSSEVTAKNIKTEDGAVGGEQPKWEPNNWRELLANIREMRKERNAPVDTMGCDKSYDENCDGKTKRFHHLVSLMLSSQTKDAITFEAMNRLRSHGLTPQKMVKISTSELEQLIYPAGFYKNKAKFIQKTSQILIDKFDSDIPNDIKGLVSLPGVGPKMAHICMQVAWNVVSGIGVDTHVHRIANRLKWVEKETKDPEHTRIALEKWLPFEDWPKVNKLLVGFGQTICTPINPKCKGCLNADICPSSSVGKKKA